MKFRLYCIDFCDQIKAGILYEKVCMVIIVNISAIHVFNNALDKPLGSTLTFSFHPHGWCIDDKGALFSILIVLTPVSNYIVTFFKYFFSIPYAFCVLLIRRHNICWMQKFVKFFCRVVFCGLKALIREETVRYREKGPLRRRLSMRDKTVRTRN